MLLMKTFYNNIQTEESKYMHQYIYLALLQFDGEYLGSEFLVITL